MPSQARRRETLSSLRRCRMSTSKVTTEAPSRTAAVPPYNDELDPSVDQAGEELTGFFSLRHGDTLPTNAHVRRPGGGAGQG